jgi:hypothetical protein
MNSKIDDLGQVEIDDETALQFATSIQIFRHMILSDSVSDLGIQLVKMAAAELLEAIAEEPHSHPQIH